MSKTARPPKEKVGTNYHVTMSFGFSAGDIIMAAQLARNLIQQVRSAPAEFRDLEADLNLTHTILNELTDNWRDYRRHATRNGINLGRDQVLRTTIDNVRDGLGALQTQLGNHRVRSGLTGSLGNIRFSQQLRGLQRRLQFHMSSLQLIMQSLTIAQGNRVAEALQTVREAQLEQRREEEHDEEVRSRQGSEEEDYEESLSAFTAEFLPNRHRPHAPRGSGASPRRAARNRLIERWRQEILSASRTLSSTIAVSESALLEHDANGSTTSPTLVSVQPAPRPRRSQPGQSRTRRQRTHQPLQASPGRSVAGDSSSWLWVVCGSLGALIMAGAMFSSLVMSGWLVNLGRDGPVPANSG